MHTSHGHAIGEICRMSANLMWWPQMLALKHARLGGDPEGIACLKQEVNIMKVNVDIG